MQIPYRLVIITLSIVLSVSSGDAQESAREFPAGAGSTIEVVNIRGRVFIKTVPGENGASLAGTVSVASPDGATGSDLRVDSRSGRTVIRVDPAARNKRLDLTLMVPERTNIKVETASGSIEVTGNFASIDARSETGSIITDVPDDSVTYHLLWTESRPRYLADFTLSEAKERAAGRYEIKGVHRDQDTRADETLRIVSLKLTTARGIILLNVPPNEVMSDLRERPLTDAAKAIIRSGDSLLMEAIRRASPKYFGDYSRTLPPPRLEPSITSRAPDPNTPRSSTKTATVRVTDLKNRSIPGLVKADFEVTESGLEREVLSIEVSDAPFNLVLLLDVSGSVDNYVNFIRKAARNFVNTVGANDRVAVVIFNEDVKLLSTFTTDKGKLSESLDTFDAGGGTAYYDALAYTISDTLRPLKGDRTAIVVLTDGDDNRSFLHFDALAGSIQESGALIYPLYVPSALIAYASQEASTDIDPMRRKYMALTAKSEGEGEKLAKLSGGVYYPISEVGQIQQAYEDIVLQMRSAYRVTFRSSSASGSGDQPSPRLKIRSKRNNTFATVIKVESTPR